MLVLALVCTIAPLVMHAQRQVDTNAHLWLSFMGDHRLSEHWSVHTEGHVRRTELGGASQQNLLRPAVNFHLGPDVLFTVGYSYYYNYRYGAYPIKAESWEHNVYEQVQLTQRFGKLALSHRYRLEQRFLAQMVASTTEPGEWELDGYAYQSRMRYRVQATWPFGKHQKVEANTLFAVAYNELFLNFGDEARLDLMQQYRASGLLGYQWSKPGSVQLGYMWQVLQRPGAANGKDLQEMNHTVHVVLTYNLDLRKAEPQ